MNPLNHRSSAHLKGSLKVLLLSGVLAFGAAAGLGAQTATPPALSIDDAVKTALAKDVGVESASWDWLAASSKADAAWMRMFPSLTAGASYQRLSEMDPVHFGPFIISSLPDIWTLSVNMQYPIFAGFRIREAANLASLTAQNKLITLEMVKRSLAFEVRRAYWEAVRASANVEMLKKNLDLVAYNRKLLVDQTSLGTVTQGDLLAADMREKQAEMDLADAISFQKRAFLTLASMVGRNSADFNLGSTDTDALTAFALATRAEGAVTFDPGKKLDEKNLIEAALSRRPETRMSSLGVEMAEHSARLAEAPLYPTLSLTGNYTFADPNQRVAFQTDPTVFTGTWALGVALSYDIGSVPANINESIAANRSLSKARSDSMKTLKSVMLDVQTCILNLNRARNDLDLVKGMVAQATENSRVTAQRKNAGAASNLDQLTADLALLRANFAIANKDIDLRIAAADLQRALAGEETGVTATPGQ
jgi:outer membrane protein